MTHLYLKQTTSSIEVVTIDIIEKLYKLAESGDLDDDSDLIGNLQLAYAYKDAVTYLTANYSNLSINVTTGYYIRFADDAVKALCIANFADDSSADGLTSDEAESVSASELGTIFENNTTITSFDELENFTGLTYLPNNAFYGDTALVTITLPNTIVQIDANSFYGDTALTTVSGCEDVTLVYNYAFYGCTSLKTVSFSSSLVTIKASAFAQCTALEDIEVSGLTVIPDNAFYGCAALTTLDFSSSVTSIGGGAFRGTTLLTDVGGLFDVITALSESGTFIESGLTSVTAPELLTTYGSTSLYNSQFALSTALITFTAVKLTNIANYCFYGCTALTTVDTPLCTEIGKSAFQNDSALTSITFGDLTSIGNNAFYLCTSLESITIPNTCTTVGEYAFRGDTSLDTVVFEDGGTELTFSSNVFMQCENITSITLPDHLTELQYDFLGYDNGLKYLIVNATTPPTLSEALSNSDDISIVYVPDDSVSDYEADNYWGLLTISAVSNYSA